MSKEKKKKKENTNRNNIYTGKLITNKKGFGFVVVEGLEEDIFVPRSGMHGAFHQDMVEVEARTSYSGRHRTEGNIIRIVERGFSQVIGTYEKSGSFGFVVPDDKKIASDIYIPKGKTKNAKDGQKVVADIISYGGDGKSPEGIVSEILGYADDPGVDILSVIRGHSLPEKFPAEVKEEIKSIRLKVPKKDMKGRKDLRDLQMVTIDGEDSKDLDDAVSLYKDGDDYILGVHIADVSNYVREGSPLDKEALERGTSVYLIDRVIPMLPEKLSNGICSLNEGVDRLAMSCIMRISPEGEIGDYEICESVINVDRRMTYTAVKKILADKDKKTIRQYKELIPMFKLMEELSYILKAMRIRRGAIDFDLPESKIILDKKGWPIDIVPYEHNVATSMIEQFMLSANETVAGHMYRKGLPFLYRVHETPDADRMNDLMELVQSFGYYIKGNPADIKPIELQKMLAGIAGRPEEDLIRSLSLRSMKQARYDTECLGHFGLAAKEYTHFTSPIRRYPDLQIHRILKEEMHGRLDGKLCGHFKSLLPKVAKQSSERERRAVDAEREVDKIKMVEYMEAHIGEEYDGVISGVTGWGMYVQLKNTVEGMVPVAKIAGDDYDYNEREYALVGRYTGRKYYLGQNVRIRVSSVDREMNTIDFELLGEELPADTSKRKGRDSRKDNKSAENGAKPKRVKRSENGTKTKKEKTSENGTRAKKKKPASAGTKSKKAKSLGTGTKTKKEKPAEADSSKKRKNDGKVVQSKSRKRENKKQPDKAVKATVKPKKGSLKNVQKVKSDEKRRNKARSKQ